MIPTSLSLFSWSMPKAKEEAPTPPTPMDIMHGEEYKNA
jgi:hypothetical protein